MADRESSDDSLGPRTVSVESRSAAHTERIAGAVALHLRVGDVVVLSGELGGGKTCFVRGAVRALGSDDHVTSPTFAIVQQYEGRMTIVHADCYRLSSARELLDIGFDEVLDNDVIAFLEWGEIAVDLVARAPLFVTFAQTDDPDSRRVQITARGAEWIERLDLIAAGLDVLRETVNE